MAKPMDTAPVDEDPAGVARGDGRVGLDEVDQRPDALLGRPGDLAVQARDDAGGDGVLEAEGAADRHRQLADLRQRPLEGGRFEALAVDLDHGEVGAGVGGPDGAGDAAAVEEGDLDALHDLVPGPDHVVVGDHHAVLGPDHPAAGPLVVGDGDHRRLDLADNLGDVAGGGLRARGEHRGGGRAGLRLLAERAPGQGRGEHGGHRQRRERRPSLSRSSGIAVVGPCGDHRSAPLWRCPS